PAALDEMADRGEMPLLSPGPAMRRGGEVRGMRGLDAGRLGAEQVQPRLQQMRHGEVRAGSDRRLGGGQGIAAVEAEQPERALVVLAGLGRRAAQGMTMLIDLAHFGDKSFMPEPPL